MNETTPITDLVGVVKVDKLRRDPLRSVLVVSNLALVCTASFWAAWTHKDWIRIGDTAAAVLGMGELVRLLWFWKE